MNNINNNYIFLSKRVKVVMKTLVKAEMPLKVGDIAERASISERAVYYDLEYINHLLRKNGHKQLEPVNTAYLPDRAQADFLNTMIFESVRVAEKDNRIAYLVCSLIYPAEKLTIDHLAIELEVSRNTIINDLQSVGEIFASYDLKMEYNKRKGYVIKGDTYTKRYVFIHYLSIFIKSSNYRFLNIFNEEDLEETISNVRNCFDLLECHIKRRDMILMAYLIMIVRVYGEEYRSYRLNKELFCSLKEYEVVSTVFERANEYEKALVSLLILSHTKTKTLHSDNEDDIYGFAKKLTEEYEREKHIMFTDDDALIYYLYKELLFIQYCQKMDFPLPFVFTEQIRKQYEEVYEAVSSFYEKHKKELPIVLYEEDIARLVLLVLSYLPFDRKDDIVRILILCNNESDLRNYQIHEVRSVSQRNEVVDVISDPEKVKGYDFDLLVTSIEIDYDKNRMIRVSSIMTDSDKERIREWIGSRSARAQNSAKKE